MKNRNDCRAPRCPVSNGDGSRVAVTSQDPAAAHGLSAGGWTGRNVTEGDS
jgi:hypothetical protein